jgi:hypothetical protein
MGEGLRQQPHEVLVSSGGEEPRGEQHMKGKRIKRRLNKSEIRLGKSSNT